MKLRKVIFPILAILIICGCSGKYESKVVTSNDQTEKLTIIYEENKIMIFNGLISSDSIPKSGYVINKSGLEYFPALVTWKNGIAYLYHHYGSFDESQNKGNIVLVNVSVKEFEKTQNDTTYKYFYY